jgi:hypothetical protein
MTVPSLANAEAEAAAAGSAAAANKGPLLLVCSTSKVSNCVIWYDKT